MTNDQKSQLLVEVRKSSKNPAYSIVLPFSVSSEDLEEALRQIEQENSK